LAQGSSRADTLARQLLDVASANHGARAALLLGRLYDPASFKPGGPVGQADAGRALELFQQASQGGLLEGEAERGALIGRLRQTASGGGPSADMARNTLREAGVQ
jgi:hypothetical protein